MSNVAYRRVGERHDERRRKKEEELLGLLLSKLEREGRGE